MIPPSPAHTLAGAASLAAADPRRSEEHLLFRVAAEWFAIPLASAEEALERPDVRRLAAAPEQCVGTIAWRGRHLPLQLPQALGVAPLAPPAAALVLRADPAPVAIVVDEIGDVLRVQPAQVRPLPGLRDPAGVLAGAAWLERQLVGVLRPAALLASVRDEAPAAHGEAA